MFAITTRNKLRSRRHAISMIWAWSRIRQQLSRTPGMLAYSTGIADLTEFFTITLWEKEIDMTLFMGSEDHRDMMWNARTWSESFWSMRWDPTGHEFGHWDGKSFADPMAGEKKKQTYLGPGFLHPSEVPDKLRPFLKNMTRQIEPEPIEVPAVLARIPAQSMLGTLRMRRVFKVWHNSQDLLYFRCCTGFGECLVLAIWKAEKKDRSTELIETLNKTFPQSWAMRFQATDFEIGHWNGVRFRELAAADHATNLSC